MDIISFLNHYLHLCTRGLFLNYVLWLAVGGWGLQKRGWLKRADMVWVIFGDALKRKSNKRRSWQSRLENSLIAMLGKLNTNK